MNKPQIIRTKLGLTKTEAGIFLCGHLKPSIAHRTWYALEVSKTHTASTDKYFDLLLMIIEKRDRGEQWAKDLLADFMVSGRNV